jgi:hypothetical protein
MLKIEQFHPVGASMGGLWSVVCLAAVLGNGLLPPRDEVRRLLRLRCRLNYQLLVILEPLQP